MGRGLITGHSVKRPPWKCSICGRTYPGNISPTKDERRDGKRVRTCFACFALGKDEENNDAESR